MSKVRAGTAYGCAFVNSGCNWPEGGCAGNCTLHRVDASQITDDRAVMVAGNVDRSTLPTATEFAAPEPIDWASYRPLAIAVLVICIALLAGWRLS